MTEEDRLAALFKGRTILLTGGEFFFIKSMIEYFILILSFLNEGSGFMGKVFIEKLLRVTEVKKIILLIRHKKGIEPKERLISLMNDAVSTKI